MEIVPYKNSSDSKKEQIKKMFDSVSSNYDLLNRVLSGGIDIYWRKKALNMLKGYDNDLILDIATGTGDLAFEANRILKPVKIIGVDISKGMLDIGREKVAKLKLINKIDLRIGDSESLLFEDNTFNTVIVSFGVRNFENLPKGLQEMYRVTQPGGHCMVVEFSKPKSFPFKQLYGWYSNNLLPLIGRLVSKDPSAYNYLPESAQAFPDGEDFQKIFRKAGFQSATTTRLTFGICSVYIGKK